MNEHYRKEIGEIDGITVYGQYYGEDGEPSVVLMQWKSWQVETDGVALWFPTTGQALAGGVRLQSAAGCLAQREQVGAGGLSRWPAFCIKLPVQQAW